MRRGVFRVRRGAFLLRGESGSPLLAVQIPRHAAPGHAAAAGHAFRQLLLAVGAAEKGGGGVGLMQNYCCRAKPG